MERLLDDLVERGFLRRDPPGRGRGWKGKYVYVPPRERKANELFCQINKCIRSYIVQNGIPEDVPVDRQAEYLARKYLRLLYLRGRVLASLLRRVLEEKTDESAIHWFAGHAGYLDELTDDTLFLAILYYRPLAPKALKILERWLDDWLVLLGSADTQAPSVQADAGENSRIDQVGEG